MRNDLRIDNNLRRYEARVGITGARTINRPSQTWQIIIPEKESKMDDKAHVMEAYGTTIQLMFRVFFESFTAAKGNTEDERNAEERFRAGVAHARHVRDRAVALLQQEP